MVIKTRTAKELMAACAKRYVYRCARCLWLKRYCRCPEPEIKRLYLGEKGVPK